MECPTPPVHYDDSPDLHPNPKPYQEVLQSNPEALANRKPEPSALNLYPSLDMDPFQVPPENQLNGPTSELPLGEEEVVIKITGVVVNLIDTEDSVELASGDFTIVRVVQGGDVVAFQARVEDEIQWPLLKDEAVVKLDESHYFFSLFSPESGENKEQKESVDDFLNYGLTIPLEGDDKLDEVLNSCSSFSEHSVSKEALDSYFPFKMEPENSEMKERCSAYWTVLAPNVEDYNGRAAKLIACRTGHLIKGILWCGDVTADRLKWGNEFMKKRMEPAPNYKEISPKTVRRIKRVKKVSKITQKVATSALSRVSEVSGRVTSAVVSSKVGKKFLRCMPGEILSAGLDGYSKVCDAVEVAGKNVISTSSTVTTELISFKYGEEAGKAASEGHDAAGHTMGTAWTFFKIPKAMNPKLLLSESQPKPILPPKENTDE